MKTTSVTLGYYNFKGRAEPIRLLLYLVGW